MAGVSLGKIAENGGRLDDQKVNMDNLELGLKASKVDLELLKTQLSEQKTNITKAYKAYAKSCKSSHYHTIRDGVTGTTTPLITCDP